MVQISTNPLILVDGSSYLYRSYHALPPLTNRAGEPTGAIYGVLNMLKTLLVQYQPSNMAVVFDDKGKTFRDELFKSYKSHRPPMPDDLRYQIAPLFHMVKAMGLPLLVINGVEADDVIGTLALAAAEHHREVLISTSDKDMVQLVSPHITLINTMSNTILGPEEVIKKFGVLPEFISDYFALIGDHADNIPGIPGIGKVIAQALLQELGGLKAIYQHLDRVSKLSLRGAKTIAAKLKQHRELAFLYYKLTTIKTDVALDISYDQLIVRKLDMKMLMLLFQRYEFKRWLSDLKTGKWLRLQQGRKITDNLIFQPAPFIAPYHLTPIPEPELTPALPKNGYQIIYDMVTLDRWIFTIRSVGMFTLAIETDGLDTLTSNLVGLCFAIQPGQVAYLPVGHNYLDAPTQLDRATVLMVLKPVLQDPTILKIGQNLKFGYGVLKKYNIELAGIAFDTMLESYVLNSVAGRHDMDSLASRFLQYKVISYGAIVEGQNHKKHLTFNQIPLEQAASYASEHADVTLQLHKKLWSYIEQTPKLTKVFEEIEMPLVPILSRLERTGVLIDENVLVTHSAELTTRLEKLEQEAHQLAEEPFNLSSTKQLHTILYDKQKLPVLKKTPRGAPSTNEWVLAELALRHYPLPKLILEYRSLAKLKSAYTDKLPHMINPLSKRVHTSYHQAVTTTGRLSSSDPNLQNIPIRNNEGRRIRQAFIAPPDAFIVAADYSQIELRVMAHYSRDPGLLKAFAVGQDIHCVTAAEIFKIPLEMVSQDQRRSAKAINFGLIYGISAFGLARQLSLPQSEAHKYINLYFERYPGVVEYIKRTCNQANDQAYVATMDGRRLYLPDIHSRNGMHRKGAERAAINAPIQGTAADIIKRAMIAIDGWLQQEKRPPVRMIMQVHDELVFEVQRKSIESAKAKIKSLMEGCFTLDVPLQVDVGVGKNWCELTR